MRLALGAAFRKLGDSARSLAWYGQVRPADRGYDRARAQMARVLLAEKRFAEVLTLADERPAEIDDALAVARVRALLQARGADEAIEFARQVRASRIPSPALVEAAVDAAFAAYRWSVALDWLEADFAGPETPRSDLRRGQALLHLGRAAEAMQPLERAALAADLFVRAKLLLAKAHHLLDRPARAVECCRDVLASEPDNLAALEAVIINLLDMLQLKAAQQAFAHAAKRFPDRFFPEMLDFLLLERRGNLRRALRPFRDGVLDEKLGEEFKERVAQAFYYSGQLGAARRLARQLGDADAAAALHGKIALVSKAPFDFSRLPRDRDGLLVRALAAYEAERFDECVELIDDLPVWPGVKLSIDNFCNLAKSRRRLDNSAFADANWEEPADGAPLPLIQQLWIGSPLSRIEQLSARSFLACGHEVHLYTYEADLVVPPGCQVRDAREVLPQDSIFTHSGNTGRNRGSLAGFADLFRWKLLHQKGGAWADCDLICLRPIRTLEIIATELARVGTVIVPSVTNCFFAARAGEAGFLGAYQKAAEADRVQLLWGEIGVHAMARLVAENDWGSRLAEPSDFCPIPHFQMVDAIDGALDIPDILARTRCRAVHLYHEVMRVGGIDKSRAFPPDSLIEVLDRLVVSREAAIAATAVSGPVGPAGAQGGHIGGERRAKAASISFGPRPRMSGARPPPLDR